jgi:hypothetical protein
VFSTQANNQLLRLKMESVLVMSYYLELRDQVACACSEAAGTLPAPNAGAEKSDVRKPAKQQLDWLGSEKHWEQNGAFHHLKLLPFQGLLIWWSYCLARYSC